VSGASLGGVSDRKKTCHENAVSPNIPSAGPIFFRLPGLDVFRLRRKGGRHGRGEGRAVRIHGARLATAYGKRYWFEVSNLAHYHIANNLTFR
jgi:hypothetical protein